MMREIEFRAWDKKLKEYDRVSQIIFFYDCPAVKDEAQVKFLFRDDWLLVPTDAILEQYIGKLDKNGKKIWEGDIVRSNSELINIGTGKRTGKFKEEDYSIEWDNNNGGFTTRRSVDNILEHFGLNQERLTEYYEVIGNIHENPELLEDE